MKKYPTRINNILFNENNEQDHFYKPCDDKHVVITMRDQWQTECRQDLHQEIPGLLK